MDSKLFTLHAFLMFVGYLIFVTGLVKVVLKFNKNDSSIRIVFPIIKILIGISVVAYSLFFF